MNALTCRLPPTHTPRMARLARLPVFFALADKRVVVAGGSAAAAWKAELLSAAGAQVDVYSAAVRARNWRRCSAIRPAAQSASSAGTGRRPIWRERHSRSAHSTMT